MATQAPRTAKEGGPRAPGRALSINSQRLTAAVMCRIARELGVTGLASAEDMRQIVEGKLGELGHPPENVRVELAEMEQGVLQDDEGIFLECQPEEEEEGEDNHVSAEERIVEDVDGNGDGAAVVAPGVVELEAEVGRLSEDARLFEEVSALRERVEGERMRYKSLRVTHLPASSHVAPEVPVSGRAASPRSSHSSCVSTGLPRGKAPPMDSFAGESLEVRFDDWLPMLQRAATWNRWSEEETLLQLAGHLRKRALLEWNLLEDRERKTLSSAVEAMCERLDPGSRSTAVQDFRYARQKETEPVRDFILRLERIFLSAYGRDQLSGETRDALLHGQLQEGLLYQLMEAPAVSGAQKYTELCIAVRNEEKRLESLRIRQRFLRRPRTTVGGAPTQLQEHQLMSGGLTAVQGRLLTRDRPAPQDRPPPSMGGRPEARRCFRCSRMEHFARDCQAQGRESNGRPPPFSGRTGPPVETNQVHTLSTGPKVKTSPMYLRVLSSMLSLTLGRRKCDGSVSPTKGVSPNTHEWKSKEYPPKEL